ncbi:MAG: ATP-grasp domain-containing protein [Thermodesulfovibrio sp.]|nr:ATP-grasp domain-containing protein [Thermodesulfovibrio sp.]
MIIPANDNLALELSKNLDKVKARVLTHSMDVHEIVRFKDRTYARFKGILPVPITYESFALKNSELPVFIKPKKGQGSFNAFKIESMEEMSLFFSQNDQDDYVIMEYLPGEEFTIDCFAIKGRLLYYMARKREKMFRGISTITTLVEDSELNKLFEKYGKLIAEELKMDGIFFFQMKFDKGGELKLLEIGPRVSGSMALNRARGVNLVEMLIYYALGYIDENSKVYPNRLSHGLSLLRPLNRLFFLKENIENIYIDFDDTLLIEKKYINSKIIKFIFDMKNASKKVFLITKHKESYLDEVVFKFGLDRVFDGIIKMSESERKIDKMKPPAMLIDDSFEERRQAIENGFLAYPPNAVEMIILREELE